MTNNKTLQKGDKVYYEGIAYTFKKYLNNGKIAVIRAKGYHSDHIALSKDLKSSFWKWLIGTIKVDKMEK